MSPTYVALDLETTGLDSSRDAIIEIGVVKFDDRGETGTFSSLVNPGRSIPLQVTQLTGITQNDVVTAPPFSALCEKLSRFVDQAVVVGHNIGFDMKFLRHKHCLEQNAFIDTFELSTILMPHESRYSLGKLMDSLGLPFVRRHRALDDARACVLLFRALEARSVDLPLRTLQSINRASRNTRWPLRVVFREAERQQARGGLGGSIGAQLRAKGLVGDAPLFAEVSSTDPLIPVDQRTALDIDRLAAMLEKDGEFARSFPGFEYRVQQVEMMRAVASAINHSRHLIVEAGTGTGKSIAYLLPAIHWAVQNGERVVVSTNTINLQDQLYAKDIPDLRALLPFEVRAAVLKGRTNYLCMRRLKMLQDRSEFSDIELRVLSKVLVWQPNTLTGDRTELFLHGAAEQEVWSQISADADTCNAERCPFRRQGMCFFHRAKQAAENAHIIVVNHALLLSDVAAGNRVLPSYNYLVVDEAHHLEDATTYQLGYTVTRHSIERLVARVGQPEEPRGGFAGDALARCQGRVDDDLLNDLSAALSSVRESNEQVVRGLRDLFGALTVFVAEQGGNRGQYDYRVQLSREVRIQPEWEQVEMLWDGLSDWLQRSVEALGWVLEILQDLEGLKIPGYDDLLQDGTALSRQLSGVHEQLASVLVEAHDDQVAWIQARAQEGDLSLNAVPLHVGQLVERHLLWPKEAVILTSATMCTNGDFSFVKERLGAWDADELAVGSPFDYQSQVLLYLPTDIPEPQQPHRQKEINESLVALARATQGRMLVLFTSHRQLRAVNSAIARALAEWGITVYAQGQGASRSQLLENFRTTEKAVLLGTRSFWEGIDVPGEALSCLVLEKLPFAVPTDPVFSARSSSVDDPFLQYAVPDAILRFRQGFGRLIRTQTDRGIVVVLDKRLQTKQYGSLFVDSLPACTTLRGPMANLLNLAAAWIDQGPEALQEERPVLDSGPGELEYVSFDEL
ncbi:MAG: 3'-5' exoribonuclease [Anaerolineae bacterium]|nr:3'-5' exoribonuclease [Anaerolineae bacterium]